MVHHAVLLSRAANKVSYGFIKQTSRVALASALGAALVNITTGLGTQESYRGTGTQEPGPRNRDPGTGTQEPGTGTQEQGPRNRDPGTRTCGFDFEFDFEV